MTTLPNPQATSTTSSAWAQKPDLIKTLSKTNNKVTLLVFTLFLPWAAFVARDLNVPSALLLIETATSFSIYKRFFNKRDGIFFANKDIDHTSISLKLPGLPLFKCVDFPTFALPTSPYFPDMSSVIKEHLQFLEENPNTHILVNSLNSLEPDSIESITNAVVIGPSVTAGEDKIGEQGLIVGWCSQTEVLRHCAIGCFVTQCGWNSVLESVVAGVAVVGCPLFADQTTNANMVEEVWGNGVRMVVGREEIKRCLEVVMDGGERAEGIKREVEKWRKVAEESVKDGGSSMMVAVLYVYACIDRCIME
ncbi:hypothetical protein L1987_37548 [Smallanthus sonchifolius]|uniref:Uncharacterized protein n=1 Tax=Smallanthus sonchifolius TaxID=185202 RepID=A0ACB9HJ84_9ASTR|nr:hypothetical protein L1987_37548 [Smallanthus sonchifolius]